MAGQLFSTETPASAANRQTAWQHPCRVPASLIRAPVHALVMVFVVPVSSPVRTIPCWHSTITATAAVVRPLFSSAGGCHSGSQLAAKSNRLQHIYYYYYYYYNKSISNWVHLLPAAHDPILPPPPLLVSRRRRGEESMHRAQSPWPVAPLVETSTAKARHCGE
jgi:hypothetical protein